ncbi:MAG: Uma2 family endonuclease [Candidatus Eremiobacteraeota bacterium]|nr:Uma2 family endonuclease [Candidatus Eremiobacteraeota bacterium]
MLDVHPEDLEYPTSDGKPMAETDLHRDQMFLLIQTLSDYYRDDPRVYVSGNILLFYQQGDKRKHLAPDVLVVKGIDKRRRNHYLLWREGKAPDVVFEITSASTRQEDLGKKHRLYAWMGVREYVLFDPRQEYLEPRLRLLRLAGETYVPVVGKLFLETLGLELVIVDDQLRLMEPNGSLLATPTERAAELGATVAVKDEALANKDQALAEKDQALAEKDQALAELGATVAAKDQALAAKDEALAERDAALADGERQRRLLEERLRELEG